MTGDAPCAEAEESACRDQAPGSQSTLLGFLCHRIVAHDITQQPALSGGQDVHDKGSVEAAVDIRSLMGLLAGYLLMDNRHERHATKLCIAEIQCIVREVLTHQHTAALSESALHLWQWARMKR
jgi:hypothetical protein